MRFWNVKMDNIIKILYVKSQTPDLKFSEYSNIYDAVKRRILSRSNNRKRISCQEYAVYFRTPPGIMTAIFEALLKDPSGELKQKFSKLRKS